MTAPRWRLGRAPGSVLSFDAPLTRAAVIRMLGNAPSRHSGYLLRIVLVRTRDGAVSETRYLRSAGGTVLVGVLEPDGAAWRLRTGHVL